MTIQFHGLLVLDKPTGMTSRDALDRAESWFPRKTRLGHAGTLDPLATGVLVACVGAATRLAEYVQAMPKTYRAGIRLGATSDTDDADGKVTPSAVADAPSPDAVERTLQTLVGTVHQVPPAYSAAKIDGRRAYALARKGKDVDLKPRPVTIYQIDVLYYAYPRLDIAVRCGKGTYIRSLARDLGERLGCGGYIESLRRTSIGPFVEAEAVSLEADPATARARLLPAWRAVQDDPPVILSDDEVARLSQGQRIAAPTGTPRGRKILAVTNTAGTFLAIVEPAEDLLQPSKLLVRA